MDTVTLVQFNMNQAYGLDNFLFPDSPRYLDRIIDALNNLPKPRVVGLNEVAARERKSRKNLADIIRREAGFLHGPYASNYHIPHWFDVGNALYSDLPLDDVMTGQLQGGYVWGRMHNRLFGPRTFILAKVRHQHGSFYAIVSHLGVEDKPHKFASARLLSRIASRINGPAVLLTDANAIPLYSVKRKNFNDGDITHENYVRCRTLQFLQLGFPQDLCPVSCYGTHPVNDTRYRTFRENRRIDYLLGKNLPKSLDYYVLPQLLSDHGMTVCTIPLLPCEAERKDVSDLVRPPRTTWPAHVVQAIHAVQEVPAVARTAANGAYAIGRRYLTEPIKKISRRLKTII